MRTRLISWSRAMTNPREGVLEGQGMVEYALILALVAIVCIGSVVLVGDEVLRLWTIIEVVIGGALAV